MTYVILGLCVAVAGFIKVSRFSTINYSVVAKDIEMDAILAVAVGGNSYSANMLAINVKRTKFLATSSAAFSQASAGLCTSYTSAPAPRRTQAARK